LYRKTPAPCGAGVFRWGYVWCNKAKSFEKKLPDEDIFLLKVISREVLLSWESFTCSDPNLSSYIKTIESIYKEEVQLETDHMINLVDTLRSEYDTDYISGYIKEGGDDSSQADILGYKLNNIKDALVRTRDIYIKGITSQISKSIKFD
jgi:hypothetical protein